jgi:ABC-type dipeptide/oligopeptide/nickel transport system ATPase component
MKLPQVADENERRIERERLSGSGERLPLRMPMAESTERHPLVVDRRAEAPRSSRVKDEVVTKRIAAERGAKGVHAFEKNAKVVRLIIGALQKQGEFFNDGVRSYVFLRDGRVLLPLDFHEPGLELELVEYGLYPNEYVTKQVIDGLRLHALRYGGRIDVHAFSFYHRHSQAVYVYDFDGGVYRITPDGTDHVDNGTDGIIFIQNPQWTPLKLARSGGRSLDWQSWLLQGIRFAPASLTEEDHRLLLRVWVLGLFFPQLFPTRPILTLIGEKGSGKSSLLRRLGQLLFGPKFNVTALTAKPDDFDAAITTDPLVVADNADEAPRWFPDRLAVVATGGTIKRRIYYTTNTVGDFPIRASLAITSRTPNFQREDVAERLLPLHLERFVEFRSEAELLADVQEKRDALVAAIMRDLSLVVIELKARSCDTIRSNFRMADFADFALKIAPVVSTREQIAALLDRLSGQQVAFASEDEPLVVLIDDWLEDDTQHVNIEREITLPLLGAELADIAGSQWLPWDRSNSKSFGQYFRTRKGTLRQLYGMTERRRHAGTTAVSFHHRRNGDLGDLGEQESSTPSLYEFEFERTEGQK